MSERLAEGVGVARAEHFESVAQQRYAATLGIWAWLITELLLFAALFLVALITRIEHPEATVEAARHLKFWIGAVNTVVLICSSLTMSMAIAFSRMPWLWRLALLAAGRARWQLRAWRSRAGGVVMYDLEQLPPRLFYVPLPGVDSYGSEVRAVVT